MSNPGKITIYTDGGCRRNGQENNVGSYGAIFEHNGYTKELAYPERNTTNNEMELKGAILGLKTLKRTDLYVELRTDSAYVCNGINNKWYKKWMANGWVTSKKEPVANRQLWIELVELYEKFTFISFKKVKGHSGDSGNDRVDEICNEAMDSIDV